MLAQLAYMESSDEELIKEVQQEVASAFSPVHELIRRFELKIEEVDNLFKQLVNDNG